MGLSFCGFVVCCMLFEFCLLLCVVNFVFIWLPFGLIAWVLVLIVCCRYTFAGYLL